MADAAVQFSAAGSAYTSWAPIFRAIYLRNSGDAKGAVDALAVLHADRIPTDYHNLRGRLLWTEAVALEELGRFDLGRERLKRAVDEFDGSGEADNLIATRTILAEAEGFLGGRGSTW